MSDQRLQKALCETDLSMEVSLQPPVVVVRIPLVRRRSLATIEQNWRQTRLSQESY